MPRERGRNIDDDELVRGLASVKLNNAKENIEITRKLVGSYNWASKKHIYIPGFPSILKRDFLYVNVGRLNNNDAPEGVGHSNEHLHDVYFEPVQEVLSHAGKELKDYNIISDRNNLRKIDSGLAGEEDYSNFDVYLKKINNTLVLKREDIGGPVSLAGIEFETKLCEKTDFEYCHVVVECDVKVEDKETKILIRGEIDARSPTDNVKRIRNYKLEKTTSTGLKVHKCEGDGPDMVTLREIKMARQLKESHYFQSWLIGVPYIVHGAGKRFESETLELENFKPRFANIASALLSYADKMDGDKVYKLERRNGGAITFLESSHPKQWFNLDI